MRLIFGKARSGKTAAIIREIRESVSSGQGHSLLIVPEQYSHEAERELCAVCGDRLSLHAEVMSFSGLARWSMSRRGGAAVKHMDEAGRLLCMALAVQNLETSLDSFRSAAHQTELQALMVREVQRLRTANADVGQLRALAAELGGRLGKKLEEFALITEAYDAVTAQAGASSEEPLSLLARQVDRDGLPEFEHVYVDGFLDFTGLEQKVLRALIEKKVPLTVCLPGTGGYEAEEFFLPSRLAAERLREIADSCGEPVETRTLAQDEQQDTLRYYVNHMFDYAADALPGGGGRVRLLRAESPREECELVAAEILRAVREEGCRWRDIAIAARGFDSYRELLESCFRRYGIPLFLTRRSPLTEKTLPYLLQTVCDILLEGWDPEDVTAYLQCGLSGLTQEESDHLCAYLYKWQLREAAWKRPEDWRQHPDGYGKPWTEDTERRLKEINLARRRVAGPLLRLSGRSRGASTAGEHTRAFAEYLTETGLAEQLERRVRILEEAGDLTQKAEYLQLWDLCREALCQIDGILGDSPMDPEGFRNVLSTVLSQYEIGTIPVALDRVSAGDFDRMRRRNIHRLFVLGCSDDRLPAIRETEGLFTAEERDLLADHALMIGGGEAEFWREYALVYHTLSLPHDRLILSWPETGFSGEKCIPATVYTQAERILNLEPERPSLKDARLSAFVPAMSLAMMEENPDAGREERAAAAWFRENMPDRLNSLKEAVVRNRGTLSKETVEALYGKRIRVSPSRLERFYSCRFQYYLQYGLQAEADEPAGFQPPEVGTFIHLILEKTVSEVKKLGGFRAVDDERLREIVRKHISDYTENELDGFAEKTARFRYLFERISEEVFRIAADLADELRKSDFEPLSFELDVSGLGERFDVDGRSLLLTGIADRVDGWQNGEKLMLRVVDYKTGKKVFSLSDVWYGQNLQMLLYLFAVCGHAEELYGKQAEPAGILYLPAKEKLLSFDHEPDAEEESSARRKEKQRSGLILNEDGVAAAWENDGEKLYLPASGRGKTPEVSSKQMSVLQRHVESRLKEMASELTKGSIQANPFYRSESDNACMHCIYHGICRFAEGENGESRARMPKLDDQTVWSLMEDAHSAQGETQQ